MNNFLLLFIDTLICFSLVDQVTQLNTQKAQYCRLNSHRDEYSFECTAWSQTVIYLNKQGKKTQKELSGILLHGRNPPGVCSSEYLLRKINNMSTKDEPVRPEWRMLWSKQAAPGEGGDVTVI